MHRENTISFESEKDHMKWVSNNRRTGLKEIGCNIVNGEIEVKYIELY